MARERNVQYDDPRWHSLRARVSESKKNICEICGVKLSFTLMLHHMCYAQCNGVKKDLWDYPEENFIVVCGPCHEELHNKVPYITIPYDHSSDLAALICKYVPLYMSQVEEIKKEIKKNIKQIDIFEESNKVANKVPILLPETKKGNRFTHATHPSVTSEQAIFLTKFLVRSRDKIGLEISVSDICRLIFEILINDVESQVSLNDFINHENFMDWFVEHSKNIMRVKLRECNDI